MMKTTPPQWLKAIIERRGQEGAYRIIRRVIIFSVGMTVVLIGIAMIVLPGPAIIVIPMGLAVLATEFVWAKVLLNYMKRETKRMTDGIKNGIRNKWTRRGGDGSEV